MANLPRAGTACPFCPSGSSCSPCSAQAHLARMLSSHDERSRPARAVCTWCSQLTPEFSEAMVDGFDEEEACRLAVVDRKVKGMPGAGIVGNLQSICTHCK